MASKKIPQKTDSVKPVSKKVKSDTKIPKNKKVALKRRKTIGGKNEPKVNMKKTSFLISYKKNLGNVSKSCEDVGINRTTFYDWQDADEAFKKSIQEINESGIDFVESKLFELIDGAQFEAVSNNGKVVTLKQAPNTQSVLFYLKTKGRSRGYVEKLEVDHNVSGLEHVTFIIKGKDK